MKIIAIEGLDKAGKATQASLLQKHLRNKGHSVEIIEFHNYHSPTGTLIRSYLDNEYDPGDVAIELIMLADKLSTFHQLEHKPDYLICDRYILSQLAYAKAKGVDTTPFESFLELLPPAFIHIFIDISPSLSISRKGKYGDNDKYESNYMLLKNVRNQYIHMSSTYGNVARIDTANKTKSQIQEEIIHAVELKEMVQC